MEDAIPRKWNNDFLKWRNTHFAMYRLHDIIL
jgi:hypothetical protein